MVQSKKDEVKKDVENAALKIFAQKGYLDTKMSDIAKEANISVGNIYTYFKNKEELFYAIVPERLMFFLRDYLVEVVHNYNKDPLAKLEDYDFLNEEYMDMLIKYRKHLIIIFEKGKGTIYEHAKEQLVSVILEAKSMYLRENHKRYNLETVDSIKLMHIIISSLINMVLDVLKEDMNDDNRKTIFKALNVYRLYGVTGLNE